MIDALVLAVCVGAVIPYVVLIALIHLSQSEHDNDRK